MEETENNKDAELRQKLACDLDSNFPDLVEAYNRSLYRFILGKVNSPESAEDILQESWLSVYQALDRFTEERFQELKIQPWLFTIVHNTFLTHVKKNKLKTVSIETLTENGKEYQISITEDDIKFVESIEDVKAVIEQLPVGYRTVLTFTLLDGLSYEEIADRLQQPIGTIRTSQSRGLKLLREKLMIYMS